MARTMPGFQKVYRDIQKHWVWEDKPFSRGQAWIDLILSVNHQDRKILFEGELIEVKRGSKVTSLRKLGEAWGWSSKKVKKFLEQLEKDNMIFYKTDSKKTVVTIENYSFYQGGGNSEETVVFQENKISENSYEENNFNNDFDGELKGNEKETPLSNDNSTFIGCGGNSKETPKKQQGNTEETVKKHQGNSEEFQRKTNKKDKEREERKECKEGEEGEEITPPSPPPLSIPTKYHKLILDQWSEVAYKTWFMDSEIVEDGQDLKIIVDSELRADAINKRFSKYLGIILDKNIRVEIREDV